MRKFQTLEESIMDLFLELVFVLFVRFYLFFLNFKIKLIFDNESNDA